MVNESASNCRRWTFQFSAWVLARFSEFRHLVWVALLSGSRGRSLRTHFRKCRSFKPSLVWHGLSSMLVLGIEDHHIIRVIVSSLHFGREVRLFTWFCVKSYSARKTTRWTPWRFSSWLGLGLALSVDIFSLGWALFALVYGFEVELLLLNYLSDRSLRVEQLMMSGLGNGIIEDVGFVNVETGGVAWLLWVAHPCLSQRGGLVLFLLSLDSASANR